MALDTAFCGPKISPRGQILGSIARVCRVVRLVSVQRVIRQSHASRILVNLSAKHGCRSILVAFSIARLYCKVG